MDTSYNYNAWIPVTIQYLDTGYNTILGYQLHYNTWIQVTIRYLDTSYTTILGYKLQYNTWIDVTIQYMDTCYTTLEQADLIKILGRVIRQPCGPDT